MRSILDPHSLLFISEVDLQDGLRLGIGREACPPAFHLAMSRPFPGGQRRAHFLGEDLISPRSELSSVDTFDFQHQVHHCNDSIQSGPPNSHQNAHGNETAYNDFEKQLLFNFCFVVFYSNEKP